VVEFNRITGVLTVLHMNQCVQNIYVYVQDTCAYGIRLFNY